MLNSTLKLCVFVLILLTWWSSMIHLVKAEVAVAASLSNVTDSSDRSNIKNEENATTLLDKSILTSNTTLSARDRKNYLEERLGPQKKPFVFVFCMSTVYLLILICGIFGNISTCFVVIFNNCMHTTTNYYLFSLAVSDVLSLLMGLPPELYSIMIQQYPWAFGETFCVIRTFIFETTTIASVLTILTFTFERWLHICKAIYAKKFSSGFSRALKIILFIWLLSGLLAAPYAFTSGIYYMVPEYPESLTCNILAEHRDLMIRVIQLSVLFLFVVPMTLISIMYALIGITLWKSQTKHKCFSSTNNSGKSNQSAGGGVAAGILSGENTAMSINMRLARLFRRQSSASACATMGHYTIGTTTAGAAVTSGAGVQILTRQQTNSSLMRKHKGGKSSLHQPPPKFRFVYPSQSHSSHSHESSTSTNGSVTGKVASNSVNNIKKSSSKNKLQTSAVEYLASVAAANRTGRKLSEYSIGDFSISYGNVNGLGGSHFGGGGGIHRTSDRASKEFEHISYRARQSRRDVVKMLFVVVLAFFTCWAPYHSQRLITSYFDPNESESNKFMMKILEIIFYISGISIYISSTINPILYNVMSKRYRTAFRNTLKMICSCHFSSKANHHSFARGSKYYSAINFKSINNLPKDSARRAQI